MTMFSSCENLQLQEPEIPEESFSTEDSAKQIFTATISADTKTYLDYDAVRNVYKTVWSEDDYIYVMNAENGTYEYCPLIEGAGTTTAKFEGSIKAKKYIALYGSSVDPYTTPAVYLSDWQTNYYNEYWDVEEGVYKVDMNLEQGAFPMVAQSKSTDFSFQNLCSVLKVNVTGDNDDYLYNFNIRANDYEYLYGYAAIDLSGREPVLNFDYGGSVINFSCWYYLSDRPLSFYVVVPAQTYSGGLTLEFETGNGYKTYEIRGDVNMRRSHIRNVNVSLSQHSVEIPDVEWYTDVTYDDGETWDTYEMIYENGMYVYRGFYLEAGTYVRFMEGWNGLYYGCPSIFRNGRLKTNTCVDLESGENWYWFYTYATGMYDIYLDPYERRAYIMSEGRSLYYLPTTEMVIRDTYDSVYNSDDGEIVKVSGVVMAQAANGFVLAMDAMYYNNIYVYDPSGYYSSVGMGDWVDLYGVVSSYRGLKELTVSESVNWYQIFWDRDDYDYTAEDPVQLDPKSYYSYSYEYVRATGTLRITTNSTGYTYYNLVMDDQTAYQVSLAAPVIDLSQYNGERVTVEGYYFGVSGSNTIYHNVIMKRIFEADSAVSGGSTENVLSGGTIGIRR